MLKNFSVVLNRLFLSQKESYWGKNTQFQSFPSSFLTNFKKKRISLDIEKSGRNHLKQAFKAQWDQHQKNLKPCASDTITKKVY